MEFATGRTELLSYAVRRMMYLPALLHSEYFDFFSSHPFDFYTQSIFSKFGFESHYTISIPHQWNSSGLAPWIAFLSWPRKKKKNNKRKNIYMFNVVILEELTENSNNFSHCLKLVTVLTIETEKLPKYAKPLEGAYMWWWKQNMACVINNHLVEPVLD